MDIQTVESLKLFILPDLLGKDSHQIGSYGENVFDSKGLDAFSDLMEQGGIGALAASISEIVARLSDADPQIITRKPSWLQQFVGKDIEQRLRYQEARASLEKLLEKSDKQALDLRMLLVEIAKMIQEHDQEIANINLYLTAGREFLEENPTAGIPQESTLVFDHPRERFARKLANLATLQTSYEMSIYQLKMARAQAIDMLDRYQEVSTVLVPVWRQHTLSILNSKQLSPEMVTKATQAHEALLDSLRKSLNGMY